jgi:tripartite-type tricarboxylate transporter receptor subunit TctC
MMVTRRGFATLATALAGGTRLGTAAAADTYPSRPVRIISPFPPGGAVDAVARKIAQKLSEQIGQQFFVENKTGATGTIGMGEAARAAPDGYTLLAIDTTYSMVPYVFRRLSWDHANGFAAITDTAWAPSVLVVRADSPLTTFDAFIDYARRNPEKLTYGSGGIGSVLHFYAEGLQQAASVRFFHVPYRGAGEAMIGLLSRQVEFAVAPTPATTEHVRGGQMRALALTGPHRSSVMPEVPTFREVGLSEFSPVYWTGLAVPTGTSAEIIDRLRSAVLRAMQATDMKEFLHSQVAEPGGKSSEDFARQIRDETELWRAVSARGHIEPQ